MRTPSDQSLATPAAPIPRLPILNWQMLAGKKHSRLPCLLDQQKIKVSTSGRASILLALEFLGLKAGDKVLVPTYHCPTMVAPLSVMNLEPVFFPINATGGARLEWLNQQPLDGVRALLAAHYFGLPQPMQELRKWCDMHGIALIEDCAHALFGRSESRPVGLWGDAAIGSLTKFLPVIEGGCLINNTTREMKLALHAPSLKHQVKAFVDLFHIATIHERLRGTGILLRAIFSLQRAFKAKEKDTPDQSSNIASEVVDPAPDGFTIDSTLSHRALTWASAALANHLPRERIVEKRRHNFERFAHLLSNHQGLHPIHTALPEDAAPYVFPIWVDNPDPGYGELRKNGIPVSRWDWVWPGIPDIVGDIGPSWSHHVLQLACHQDLRDNEIEAIASAVIKLYTPPRSASN